MGKVQRYYTGLILDGFHCPWCGGKCRGMVFQNRIRWMVRMYCGHIKVLGYVASPEYLNKQGLANYATEKDPRIKAMEEHDADIAMRQAKERAEYEMRKQETTLTEKYIQIGS